MDWKSAQALQGFISLVVLRDALVQWLGIIGGVPLDGAQSVDQSDTKARAQLVTATPTVEISSSPIVTQSVVAQPAIKEQVPEISSIEILWCSWRKCA